MKNNKLTNFFMYCGISREDYNSIRPMLWARNLSAIKITAILSGGIGILFFLINIIILEIFYWIF